MTKSIAAGSKYTHEDVSRALLTYIMVGNMDRAIERLKEEGHGPTSRHTLGEWVKRFPDVYARLHEEHAPKVEAAVAAEAIDTARLAAEAERLAIEKTIERLRDDAIKDPSGVAQRMSTVKGINIDKHRLLNDKPTEIHENRSLKDLMRALEAKRVLRVPNLEQGQDYEPPAGIAKESREQIADGDVAVEVQDDTP